MVPGSRISRSHTEAPPAEVQRAGSTALVLDQLSCPTTPSPHVFPNCSSGHDTSLFKPHVSPAPLAIKPQSAQDGGPTWPRSPAPPSSQCPHLCLESGHTHAPATRPALTSRVSDSRPLLRGPSRTTLPPARNKPHDSTGLPGQRRLPQQLSTGTQGRRTIHWVSSSRRGHRAAGGPESM